jgi:hypothetical protein
MGLNHIIFYKLLAGLPGIAQDIYEIFLVGTWGSPFLLPLTWNHN